MEIVISKQKALWPFFLITYALFKYFVDARGGFQWAYLQNVLILVLLTAVIPYYMTLFIGVRLRKNIANFWVLIGPLLLVLSGFAIFSIMFTKPYVTNFSVLTILPNAITPALFLSGILIVTLQQKSHEKTRCNEYGGDSSAE